MREVRAREGKGCMRGDETEYQTRGFKEGGKERKTNG